MQVLHPHITIGVDEAGRGSWYGLVVASAFAFDPLTPPDVDFIASLADSKKLSAKARKKIYEQAIMYSMMGIIYFGIGVVDNEYIDAFGIRAATKEAMKRALVEICRKIPKTYELHSFLIDGNDNFDFLDILPKTPIYIIAGDNKVKEISAASIMAKEFRDRLMVTYSTLHPDLLIHQHKGYGTHAHAGKLMANNITSFHRTTYKPIRRVMSEKKPQVLLHVCCGPDATVPIMDLKKDYEVIAYWYDPNIQPKAEYDKRRDAFAKICDIEGVEWIEGEYDVKRFFQIIKGYENTPERGEKCTKCYDMRLERSALFAKELGVEYYTSTLNTSPHKDLRKMFELGDLYGYKYGIEFLKIPFRKNGGFNRSVEYTRLHSIYRQDYCGCVYSDTFPGRIAKAKSRLQKKGGWTG